MLLKSVQTRFTDPSKSTAGHYLNKHTKERLKKRNREEDEVDCIRKDSATLTYNLLYIPRILKSDLRRQYPIMYMNVFNSCDYYFLKQFVSKFFHEDSRFIFQAPKRQQPLWATSVGRDNLIRAWFDRMNDAPDLCMELTSVQIRVRSDGTCTCFATYKYSGTAICFVDRKRVETVLPYCRVNESGLLTLPDPFAPSSHLSNATFSSRLHHCYAEGRVRNLNPFNPDPDEVLRDITLRWNDIRLIDSGTTNQSSNTVIRKRFYQNDVFQFEDQMIHIPSEENEYLYTLFANAMNLTRPYPRVPLETEQIQLGLPFQCHGDLLFQLDDQSRIISLDTRVVFGAKPQSQV